jgi:hypothetical protein
MTPPSTANSPSIASVQGVQEEIRDRIFPAA